MSSAIDARIVIMAQSFSFPTYSEKDIFLNVSQFLTRI